MHEDLNVISAMLLIFIISLGVIFFFNMTIRYFGRITRFEILVMIIIIGSSFGYVLSLMSLQQTLPEIRDLQRTTDLQLIADGLDAYFKTNDYESELYASIPDCPEKKFIGTDAGNLDLVRILEGNYLAEMPIDPDAINAGNSLYKVCINENLRIEVSAPGSELHKEIFVIK